MNDRGALRLFVWLYLALWVFEGAMRRWGPPALATPLLVVRDPVVLMIYMLALRDGIFRLNAILMLFTVVISLSFVAAIAFGHRNIGVALFGARSLLLHLPLIYLLPHIFNRKDLLHFGRWVLIISVPMTMLLVVQYQSPPGAWVNRGIAGEGTAVFSGALGRNRPPGTWTFIIGPAIFYPLVTACWFALFLNRGAPLWLLAASGAAIFVTIPVSISRMLFVAVAMVAAAGLIAMIRKGMVAPGRVALAALAVVAIGVGMSYTPVFRDGMTAFAERWTRANTNEGDGGGLQAVIAMRIFGGMGNAVASAPDAPLFGHGLGLGTQAGARMAFGRKGFFLGEGEWVKTVNELGPFLGLAFLGLRFTLAVLLGLLALREVRAGNSTPLLFYAVAAPLLVLGQWGQTTVLGGTVIAAGLVTATSRSQNPSL